MQKFNPQLEDFISNTNKPTIRRRGGTIQERFTHEAGLASNWPTIETPHYKLPEIRYFIDDNGITIAEFRTRELAVEYFTTNRKPGWILREWCPSEEDWQEELAERRQLRREGIRSGLHHQ